MRRAPFTLFGKTRLVRIVTYTKGEKDSPPRADWNQTLWADDNNEQHVGRVSAELPGTTRVVLAGDWANAVSTK